MEHISRASPSKWSRFTKQHGPQHIVFQVKPIAKKQLELWGIEYFDLYLVHFPISLEYVKPEDKYPPEWWGLDGKIHTSAS